MLSVAERAGRLARGVFGGLDETTRLALAERMGERELAPGQPLFLQGEPGGDVFVVISGSIEVVRDEAVVAVLGPGELIGEMAVLGAGWRTASGRARGLTELLFLKEKALKLLIQQTPDVAFAIFSVLVERLTAANDLAIFLSGEKSERGRIEVTGGDLTGQTFPLYHQLSVLGKSRGSMLANGLRLALPSQDEALRENHATLTLDGSQAFIQPLAGTVTVAGELIEDCVALSSADEIGVGGLRFRVVTSGK